MLDTIIIVTIQIVVSALMAGSSISKCPYSRLAFAPSGRSVRSLLVPALSNKFINGYQDDYTVHHIGQGTVLAASADRTDKGVRQDDSV